MGLEHTHITPEVVTDPGKATLSKAPSPRSSPWTDTRKTFRASPAALVAMHSNRPSSRGPGLEMSSDPKDCKLCGQSTHQDHPCPVGGSRRGKPHPTGEPFGAQGGRCCGYL